VINTDEPGGSTPTTTDSAPEDERAAGWAAFSPEPPGEPGQLRQIRARVVAIVGHEWLLAALGSVLLAVVMTWPTLRHPTRTIPQDIWDPTLQAWQIAWSGHALATNPAGLWHSNAFYPERYTLAFTDAVPGYALAGLIGTGPSAALLRYNIVYVLAFALAFFGAYALVRQLGASRAGAAVAAAAFAYAPWRWAHGGHLNILSSGGIALALAMLARGHGWSLRHGYRPDTARPAWALAGWLVAAWQMTLGFGIGLPFAYVLALIGAIAVGAWAGSRRYTDRSVSVRGLAGSWASRPPFGRRLLYADLGGLAAFAVTAAGMAYPYLKVVEQHPYARRSIAELALFSPPVRGLFTAPGESLTWGMAHAGLRAGMVAPAETTLLPGFILYGLAAAGLFMSTWSVRWRVLLGTGVLATAILALGTNAPAGGQFGDVLLYRALPGWDGLRTPGRLILWTTLLLGVLAAGAVSAFAQRVREYAVGRVPAQPGFALRVAMVVPLLLVLYEGRSASDHPVVPPAPAAMHTAQAPLLVLPSEELTDENVMLWGTDRFPLMVNGASAFGPHLQARVRQATAQFPDPTSIDLLRQLGVKTVIVVKSRAAGTPYEYAATADVAGLDITRTEDADAVVYRL
jgi:hypothetical protein